MIKVEIQFYAQLKDFFGDTIFLELPVAATVASLLAALEQQNALAAEWLRVSRAANEDAFLAIDTVLAHRAKYYILPPSSGG